MGRPVRTSKLYSLQRNNPIKSDSKSSLERVQTFVSVLISIATAFIAWQTYNLSQRTESNNEQLKAIESQLSETKFGFERIRDIYDRTEKYLSSADQSEGRGRILVILINGIPDTSVRSELLAVVTEKAKLPSVAAKAADLKIGNTNSQPSMPKSNSFIGKLELTRGSDGYTLTTASEIGFVDSGGVVWTVPKGFVTDGSSIPRAFWSVIGPPLSSNYTAAVVLHDYYATTKTRSSQAVKGSE